MTCGATRAMVSLIELDFYQAFRWNIFFVTAGPILAVVYACQAYVYVVKNKIFEWLDIFIYGFLVSMIVFAILRNINMFDFLRQTQV